MKKNFYSATLRLGFVVLTILLLLFSFFIPIGKVASEDLDPTLGSSSGIWVSSDDSPTGIGTNEIRWGTSTGYGRSGFRFDGVTTPQTFNFDEPFLIGTFKHYNWPVTGTFITWTDLKVTLHFSDPSVTPDPTFTFRFNFDETTNSCSPNYPSCCPYGDSTGNGCDDKITLPQSYGEQSFRIDDKLYTLKIQGFVSSWPGGTLVSGLITGEEKTNTAFLVGILSSVLVPEPAISIIKETSADNTTWYDANEEPGPYIPVGNTVYWHYIVQNTGNVSLSNITVTDDNGTPGDTSDDFTVSSGISLDSGGSTTVTSSGVATGGQYGNVGTATGYYEGTAYTDSDSSHYYGTYSICGHKFDGDNNNAPLSGWTIYIDSNSNGSPDTGEPTAVTDENGSYCFTGLLAGTYRIREVLQSGWSISSPTNGYHSITVGPSATNVDFVNTRLRYSICGHKFDGDNNNAPLSGRTIYIDSDNDGILDTDETSTTTGTDGSYCFTNLLSGTYVVREVLQSGWSISSPTNGYHSITVGPSATNVDFVNTRLRYSICG
ncbi:MAG: THxN family PEP-CTERM protein, partial [Bacteroidales bacterium]|nr:THxN family PEP-CTERM protein [Bacteroidales bacterium]